MANSVYYGTCTTAASEELKIVKVKLTTAEKASIAEQYKNGDYLTTTSAFFKTGDLLTVHFTYSNTNTAPKLVIKIGDSSAEVTDVSGYGRSILYKTEAAAGSGSWDAGETITFTHILSADGTQTHWDLNDGGRATSTVYGVTKLENLGIDDTSGAVSLNKAKNLIELATGGSLSYSDNYLGSNGIHIGTLTLSTSIDGQQRDTSIQLHSPTMAGFATQTWVNNKSYTTMTAVQNWVNAQGFLTSVPQTTMYPYNGNTNGRMYQVRVAGGEDVEDRADCGVSNSYARGDHIHRIGSSTITGALGFTPSSNVHTHTIAMGRTDRDEDVTVLESGKEYYIEVFAPTGSGSTIKRFRMPPAISPGDVDLSPYLTIEDAASTYALVGHTHPISITTSSGTSQRTLNFGTKYSLTAGGNSYIFTMPSNPLTDGYVIEEIQSKNLLFSASEDVPTYGTNDHGVSQYPSTAATTSVAKESLVIRIACGKNNYTPVGIVGWNLEMPTQVPSTSAFNDSKYQRPERINVWSLFIAGTNICCQMSNQSTVRNSVQLKVKVLYKHN